MNKDKLMAVTKTILKITNLRVYPTKAQKLVLYQTFLTKLSFKFDILCIRNKQLHLIKINIIHYESNVNTKLKRIN